MATISIILFALDFQALTDLLVPFSGTMNSLQQWLLFYYLLSMDTSLFCLFPFKVLSPKLQRIGNFFGCSMYGNVFLVCCFTKHRAPTAEFSFFLSKNVTYFFVESMITLLYQPLCCGSPMGTMNFSMCNGI